MSSSRIFSVASQRIWPRPRGLVARGAPTQRRLASSSSSTDRQPSNVSEFYKNFTRPVAKVLLMAVFTYQLAYWGWLKLEQDEIRAERQAEIASLERQVVDSIKFQANGADPEVVKAASTGGEKKAAPWWKLW